MTPAREPTAASLTGRRSSYLVASPPMSSSVNSPPT